MACIDNVQALIFRKSSTQIQKTNPSLTVCGENMNCFRSFAQQTFTDFLLFFFLSGAVLLVYFFSLCIMCTLCRVFFGFLFSTSRRLGITSFLCAHFWLFFFSFHVFFGYQLRTRTIYSITFRWKWFNTNDFIFSFFDFFFLFFFLFSIHFNFSFCDSAKIEQVGYVNQMRGMLNRFIPFLFHTTKSRHWFTIWGGPWNVFIFLFFLKKTNYFGFGLSLNVGFKLRHSKNKTIALLKTTKHHKSPFLRLRRLFSTS